MSKEEKISYEDSKCCGCGKVYTVFMVVSSSEWKDTKFVICSSCAKDVSKALDSMQVKK